MSLTLEEVRQKKEQLEFLFRTKVNEFISV